MADKHRYNIILLGEVGVGKTSLYNRIKTGRYDNFGVLRLQEDCCRKTMVVQGEQIRVSACYAEEYHIAIKFLMVAIAT